MIAGIEIENRSSDPDHAPLRVICHYYVPVGILPRSLASED